MREVEEGEEGKKKRAIDDKVHIFANEEGYQISYLEGSDNRIFLFDGWLFVLVHN